MRKVVFGIFALAAMMVGCTSIDCSMNNAVLANYEFRNGRTDSADHMKDLILTVYAERGGSDTILNMQANPKNLQLPVSYARDVDKLHFVFIDKDSVEVAHDVISIAKTNEPVFESVDCAPRYNHKVLSATTTKQFIDSIEVIDNTIDNDPTKVHFLLYIRSDK